MEDNKIFEDLETILSNVFKSNLKNKKNIKVTETITFEESFFGTEKKIKIKDRGNCKSENYIKIKIPEGIKDNQTIIIKLKEQEVYINVKVLRHSIYRRIGDNIIVDIPIAFTKAILGTNLEIPMVDGSKMDYRIPKGIQNGTRFVIKGKGFKNLKDNKRGDFVFRLNILIPKKLTKEQEELIKKFEETIK